MAPHSSTLAWKIPWTEEPGGQQAGQEGEQKFTSVCALPDGCYEPYLATYY